MALWVGACASSQRSAALEADARQADAAAPEDGEHADAGEQKEPEPELTPPGPPVSPPVASIAASRGQDEGAAGAGQRPRAPRQQGPAQTAAAEQPPDDTAILVQASRTDGRPEWWIDGPVHADGRLRIAAEALGHDVLEARRAAISAGRRTLERLSGDGIHDERVVYATVRPLPRGASPSGPRFVGYVLMSSAAPDGE